ncbi:hypothetical protein D9M73_284840 [compost metagenome]
MPNGWRSSEPVPKPIISGTAPSIAARVVIMIGRKRASAASRIASYGARPRWRWAARAKSIIRMPFFLTMPISSTMPISAITENSCPQAQSISTAPIPAEGSVDRMVSGCTKLS